MNIKSKIKGRKGVTIIEVVIAGGLLSMVIVVMMMLLTTMISLWTKGASGTSSNSHASIAMRKLVLDIEEGKSAMIVAGKLAVTFPTYNSSTKTYSRGTTGVTAIYYLSGQSGSESTGTYLWKSDGTNKKCLSKNIESVGFTVTSGKLVGIRLIGRDVEGGAVSPNLIQQSIKLRNS